MSDFFTRVAARALGVNPTIQPLVVSRYEPARMPALETPESEVDSRQSSAPIGRNLDNRSTGFSASTAESGPPHVHDEDPQSAKSIETVEVAQPEPARTKPAGLLRSVAEPISSRKDSVIDPGRIIAPLDSPTVPPSVLNASSETPAHAIAESHADYSAAEESSIVELNSKNLESLEATNLKTLEATRDVLNDNRERIGEPALAEGRSLWARENDTLKTESDSGLLVTPAKTRRITQERESLPESFPPGSESSLRLRDDSVERTPPVIRVTIGRIEVRAVTTQPPPPPPSAPAAPKLSLDEFLRQHNGRRQ